MTKDRILVLLFLTMLSCAAAGSEPGNRRDAGDSFGKSLATFEEVEELGMIFEMTQKQGSGDA